MKQPFILLLGGVLLCTFIILLTPLKKSLHESLSKLEHELNEKDEDEEEEKEAGIDKEMMFWFQSRAYPDPYYVNDKYARAWQQALKLKQQSPSIYSRMQSAGWVSLGPNTGIGGRVLAVEVNPVKNTSLFIGTASGGIWKSYNSGSNWVPVTTNTNVLGVSSILINPLDTMVMYAGTGEVYRMDTNTSPPLTPNPGNFGVNVWKARGTYGVGILKSTDGGNTWSQVLIKSEANMFAIQALKFDPSNPNIVYACATDGLYKTTNAGTSWTQVIALPYVSDVVINAKNTNQIVLGSGNFSNTKKGIWRSTNGGTSWTNITTGLPSSFQGFIKLDNVTSLGNRDTIIASIGVSEATGVKELYRSTNFGSNWTALNNSTHTQWQYWSAHTVAINPSNTDKLVFGGVKLYNYTVSAQAASGSISVHDDIHAIKFDPTNANIVYVGCDGGVYKSTNAGADFNAINNGLTAVQFYATIGVSPAGAANNVIVGGLQDNGVVWSQNGGSTWAYYPGSYGDGAACAVDPTNGSNILASGDARNFTRSADGGSSLSTVMSYLGGANDSRTAFVAPVAYSKKKPSVVYVGTDNLHKSTNGGSSWTNNGAFSSTSPTGFIESIHKTAIAIAVSPTAPNGDTLYVSTSNFAQYDNDKDNLYLFGQPNLLKSTNGGATLPMTSVKGTLPNRFVLDIAMSPTYHDSVYVTLGGFGTSHIYVSPDGGSTWNALGGSLPDVPFTSLVFDPVNSKIIYAGCDLGVYVSPDRGLTWADFNNGFWDATEVVDLQIDKNNKLLAATHGKGMFRSDLFTASTLPSTLTSFNGSNQGNYNLLHWTIEQENGIQRYELERSSDGVNYQNITNIPAGNRQSRTTYTYNDAVGSNTAEYYYRLKVITTNGSFSYSAVIFIKVVSKNKFWVTQNPIHDYILLQYNLARDQSLKINLFSNAGALLRKEDYTVTRGSGAYSIYGLGQYPSGVYLLRIESGGEVQTIRLVKN